jgi:hypothetical protein
MKKKTLIIALVLVVGLVLAATPALAAMSYTDFQAAQQARVANSNGMGKYFAGTQHTFTAKQLGLTEEELYNQRIAGKSILEIATAKGISQTELTAALVAAKIDQINGLYANGTITQERQAYMLSNVEANTAQKITRTTIGGQQGFGKRGGGMSQGVGLNQNMQNQFGKGMGGKGMGGSGFGLFGN